MKGRLGLSLCEGTTLELPLHTASSGGHRKHTHTPHSGESRGRFHPSHRQTKLTSLQRTLTQTQQTQFHSAVSKHQGLLDAVSYSCLTSDSYPQK